MSSNNDKFALRRMSAYTRCQERTGRTDAALLLRLRLSGIHEHKRLVYTSRDYALHCDAVRAAVAHEEEAGRRHVPN